MSAPRSLVVVGGGEHSRVVIEAARSRADLWNVTGFVDPRPCADTARQLGVQRLGGDEWSFDADRRAAEFWFILGVGCVGVSALRQGIVARYSEHPIRWATVVHASAWVSPTAAMEPGAAVLAGATVNAGARLGGHAVVNTGAVVEHDVVLGDFAQAAPGSVIGGGTRVGAGSYLGLGSRVRDHIDVGRDVMVGMGAVVVHPVRDGEVVMGVPARAAGPGDRSRA